MFVHNVFVIEVDSDVSVTTVLLLLYRSLPRRFKVDVKVTPGSHASEEAVNKQLNDKERVAAAMEKGAIVRAINQCLNAQSPNV